MVHRDRIHATANGLLAKITLDTAATGRGGSAEVHLDGREAGVEEAVLLAAHHTSLYHTSMKRI